MAHVFRFFASPALAGEVPNEVRRRGSCFVFSLVFMRKHSVKDPLRLLRSHLPRRRGGGEKMDSLCGKMSRQTGPSGLG